MDALVWSKEVLDEECSNYTVEKDVILLLKNINLPYKVRTTTHKGI
jgi:hypothetical protein